ncbi:MAG TPA: hypothetical protein VF322_06600 [Gammaproteobacteria bacterium]
MTFDSLLAITPFPAISALLWIVLAVAVLYLSRGTAQKVIAIVCEALHEVVRMAAQAVQTAEQRLSARNREVLLAAGREAKERIVEREFDRIADAVHRDLAGYPALQRRLSEAVARIEEDHQQAAQVPPEPPGWTKAVEAMAKLDAKKDASVAEILADIHDSIVKAQGNALNEYRAATRQRHELLRRMMPQWRIVQQALARTTKGIESILERSRAIDRHLQDYCEIVQGTERATQVLSSSSLVQFFVSALVLGVAVGGAAINFSLIARPMAEMVGGTTFIGNFRTSEIAALVIIMVEISMGLFLMESLRITRLFPVIGALSDKARVRMVAVTFVILLLLASVEAGLAYMRELLMQDELATAELLRGGGEAIVQSDYLWITTAAQMGMGFTLPFALVFVAIPLETFVHSLRTVLGLCGIGVLKTVHLVLRLLGTLFTHLGTVLVRLYDIPIFMPLWIEAAYKKRESAERRRDGYAEVRQ